MRTLKQLQEALKNTDCKVAKYRDGSIGVYMGKAQGYVRFEVYSVKDAIESCKNWGVI